MHGCQWLRLRAAHGRWPCEHRMATVSVGGACAYWSAPNTSLEVGGLTRIQWSTAGLHTAADRVRVRAGVWCARLPQSGASGHAFHAVIERLRAHVGVRSSSHLEVRSTAPVRRVARKYRTAPCRTGAPLVSYTHSQVRACGLLVRGDEIHGHHFADTTRVPRSWRPYTSEQ